MKKCFYFHQFFTDFNYIHLHKNTEHHTATDILGFYCIFQIQYQSITFFFYRQVVVISNRKVWRHSGKQRRHCCCLHSYCNKTFLNLVKETSCSSKVLSVLYFFNGRHNFECWVNEKRTWRAKQGMQVSQRLCVAKLKFKAAKHVIDKLNSKLDLISNTKSILCST